MLAKVLLFREMSKFKFSKSYFCWQNLAFEMINNIKKWADGYFLLFSFAIFRSFLLPLRLQNPRTACLVISCL